MNRVDKVICHRKEIPVLSPSSERIQRERCMRTPPHVLVILLCSAFVRLWSLAFFRAFLSLPPLPVALVFLSGLGFRLCYLLVIFSTEVLVSV